MQLGDKLNCLYQTVCNIVSIYPGDSRRLAITKTLTLAELHVSVLTSFIEFNKALTKFNEALTKPYHGLIEILQ